MQPGCHVGHDACETQVVLWGQLGRRGKVDVCPALEPDAGALVRAKGEWGRHNSRRFDGDCLEEGEDVVAIFCNGCQHLGRGCLGGGQLRLTWIRFRVPSLNRDDAIVFVGLVCLACGILLLLPLHYVEGENLEELAHV